MATAIRWEGNPRSLVWSRSQGQILAMPLTSGVTLPPNQWAPSHFIPRAHFTDKEAEAHERMWLSHDQAPAGSRVTAAV